jgi:hypothetical protein
VAPHFAFGMFVLVAPALLPSFCTYTLSLSLLIGTILVGFAATAVGSTLGCDYLVAFRVVILTTTVLDFELSPEVALPVSAAL